MRYTEVNGTKYAVGYIVYYDCIDDDLPVFAKIQDIVLLPNTSKSLFMLNLFKTLKYEEHYHAYVVLPTTDIQVCSQNELADYHPLSVSKAFTLSSPMFIRVKYSVV